MRSWGSIAVSGMERRQSTSAACLATTDWIPRGLSTSRAGVRSVKTGSSESEPCVSRRPPRQPTSGTGLTGPMMPWPLKRHPLKSSAPGRFSPASPEGDGSVCLGLRDVAYKRGVSLITDTPSLAEALAEGSKSMVDS